MRPHNKNTWLPVFAICCIIVGAWLRSRIAPGADGSGKPIAVPSAETQNGLTSKLVAVTPSIAEIFSAGIVFYGRVQTMKGAPIGDAKVAIAIADRFGGGSSKSIVHSDKLGRFKVSGSGVHLSIRVSKEGFFSLPESSVDGHRSSGGFAFGTDLGEGIHRPDSNDPVIFTLIERGPSEALVAIRERQANISRVGEPSLIQLDSQNHAIEVRCWTNDSVIQLDGRYDWKMVVRAHSGRIQRRPGIFDFEAPLTGYAEFDTVDMPRTLARPNWKTDVEVMYWVRFDDDTYGRVELRMIAGGDHFALLSGHFNPAPGSRNLTPPSN
jgi:hypothetical protein